MKFAKTVFWIAGIWGVLVVAPLYLMFDLIGRKDPPPITHQASSDKTRWEPHWPGSLYSLSSPPTRRATGP